MRPQGLKQTDITKERISNSMRNHHMLINSALREGISKELDAKRIKSSERKLDAISRRKNNIKRLLFQVVDELFELITATVSDTTNDNKDIQHKPTTVKVSESALRNSIQESIKQVLGGTRKC